MATPRKPGAKRGRPATGRTGKKLSIYAKAPLLAKLVELNSKQPGQAAVEALEKALLSTTS